MKTCPTCQSSYPQNFAVCPQDGTPLVEVGAWAEGSVIRGKYQILSKIGQGGMGAVFKARHLAFDELRALKVMAPELLSDELFVKRFKHEAVITRKLQHPNAVRVDDIDEAEDGRPFIVMEFIEGRSLKKLIQDEGPQPALRTCSTIKQVASALDAAHRLGMIHRDIKPENIVLVETPEGEQAKVLDFGIAKMKEARLGEAAGMTLTGAGVVIGTPQYMSPEQAMGKRGDELDGRSDLYSLGVVMYQMLTADLPFRAETTMEMLLAHMQKPPMPIRALRPELEIPEAIANLTMKLLSKNRDLRPASARGLIQEIESAEKAMATAAPGRVLAATRVVSPREIQAAVAEGGAGRSMPPVAPASPRAPVAPKPAPRAAAVVSPVVAPAAQKSRWGIWVGAMVLVLGLGGGGWYFFIRPSARQAGTESTTPAPVRQAPTTNPQPPPTSTAPASAAGTSSSETATPQESGQEVRRTAATSKSVPPAASGRENVTAPGGGGGRPAVNANEIKSALTQAKVFSDRGDYDTAISVLEEVMKRDPSNPTLRKELERVRKAKAAEEKVGIQ